MNKHNNSQKNTKKSSTSNKSQLLDMYYRLFNQTMQAK
ncbi:MAG: hypothetical protein ACI88A_000992 [Paraglaciecola sp.]|jgi:hypothetical protein